MRCIIVDDEPLAREGMRSKIEKLSFLTLVGEFRNGLDANQFLAENTVDLVFLDIQMPDITGLALLRTLKNPPLVIFATAFPQHALEGFDLDAVDYLVKPIDFQRFVKAVNKAREVFDLRQNARHELAEVQRDFLYLRADRQFVKVFFRDIRYMEGMKNYVMFHTLREKIMTAISLQQIMEQLPARTFARINKSFVVNADFVRRVLPDFLVLDDGTELPLGKNYQEDFIRDFVKNSLLERKG